MSKSLFNPIIDKKTDTVIPSNVTSISNKIFFLKVANPYHLFYNIIIVYFATMSPPKSGSLHVKTPYLFWVGGLKHTITGIFTIFYTLPINHISDL